VNIKMQYVSGESIYSYVFIRDIHSGVGTMGIEGTLYPPRSGLVPPQVKDAAYVKILSKRL